MKIKKQLGFSKNISIILITIFVLLGGIAAWYFLRSPKTPGNLPSPPSPPVAQTSKSPLVLASKFANFSYQEKAYHNPEYSLPLRNLPENYQRDIVDKFGTSLNKDQKETLLSNGALIISGTKYDHFEDAFLQLEKDDIPVFVTSDSVLHLFHIEFNEILKNLEVKKLSPLLEEFLKSTTEESLRQYRQFRDKKMKELARRNIAYLSVAAKLINPDYNVPSFVKKDVNQELERIKDHKGFYKSPLFSLDCPTQCLGLAFTRGKYPDGESCSQEIKGGKIRYQGKLWSSKEFYKEICTRKCYCEDYSQYIPRGHYTSSEALKRYFKSMMWLGRMSFKARGDNWTKQALLLTLAVQNAKATFNGKEVRAIDLWKKIYSVTGFFAGASDDLTFYDYSRALDKLISTPPTPEAIAKINLNSFQEKIAELRSPKILGGFEIDLAGKLKDLTQGMRLIGQRYAVDSQILGDLVYKNIGPNPKSPYYQRVLDAYCLSKLSKPKDFYLSCQNMEQNRTIYWNDVCSKALEMYLGYCNKKLTIKELYSVCRLMPSGLDVANVLGSKKAKDILYKYYQAGYCNYDSKQKELEKLISSYTQEDWNRNLYNTWLWMLQPLLADKPKGYPVWMQSSLWQLKDLITSLASWAELRHDTILYVKQSYTWAIAITRMVGAAPPPIEAKYYGYVEPNPELFARAKYAVDYLNAGLKEQGVMTDDVSKALQDSSQMMTRLKGISERELERKTLTEADYNYIKNIGGKFDVILRKLASVLTITKGKPGKDRHLETSLGGTDEAFKTSQIADVHTETNTKKVLEVGTGRVDWLLVAHKSKDGRIGIAVGPMFSYYEFAWPLSDRLTDEKWRAKVLSTIERPIWYRETKVKAAQSPYIIK